MNDINVKSLHIEDGAIDIKFQADQALQNLADIFVSYLDSTNAPNFLEVQGEIDRFKSPETMTLSLGGKERITITIQRVGKETPCDQRNKALAEVKEATEILESLSTKIDALIKDPEVKEAIIHCESFPERTYLNLLQLSDEVKISRSFIEKHLPNNKS